MFSASRKDIRASMIEMAFTEVGRYFKHPDTQFLIEFPPGPLSVGKEPVKQISKISFITGVLNVISPTDCVKDRLAAYFHWGDQQSLTQAILVCMDHIIDFEEIRRWSNVEGKLEEYENIRQKLQIRSAREGLSLQPPTGMDLDEKIASFVDAHGTEYSVGGKKKNRQDKVAVQNDRRS